MKKTKKKILGFLGLSLVAIMTFVAAIMPGPEASALAETDTLQVRVVGNVPSVAVTQPSENIVTSEPEQWIAIAYENTTSIKIELTYTDKDGNTKKSTFANFTGLNYDPGTKSTNINLASSNYGYGKFVFSISGVGYEGTEVPFDGISITYIPVTGSAEQAANEDEIVNLTIDSFGDDVETIEVYLGDDLLKTVSRAGFNSIVKLSFAGRESGTYTLSLVSKDASGKQLYLPYYIDVDYKAPEGGNELAPDTGRFFQGLDISKEDALLTSLVVFLTAGIIAFMIVMKIGRKNKNLKKK